MRRKINREQVNVKEKNIEPTGIFFHKENLTDSGQIIQDAIKQRTNHR